MHADEEIERALEPIGPEQPVKLGVEPGDFSGGKFSLPDGPSVDSAREHTAVNQRQERRPRRRYGIERLESERQRPGVDAIIGAKECSKSRWELPRQRWLGELEGDGSHGTSGHEASARPVIDGPCSRR